MNKQKIKLCLDTIKYIEMNDLKKVKLSVWLDKA